MSNFTSQALVHRALLLIHLREALQLQDDVESSDLPIDGVHSGVSLRQPPVH